MADGFLKEKDAVSENSSHTEPKAQGESAGSFVIRRAPTAVSNPSKDSIYDSLELPAPFHIREPERQADGSLRLSWEDAARGEAVTYRVTLDDSWDFKTPLLSRSGLSSTEWVIDQLPAGQYFLSVTAQTAGGKSQIAYETYSTEVKTTVYGVLCFYVLPDGSVHASYFNEGE